MIKKILGYVFYTIGFYLMYKLLTKGFPLLIENYKFSGLAETIGVGIGVLILIILIILLLWLANKWTQSKRKYFIMVLVFISLLSFILEDDFVLCPTKNQKAKFLQA